MTTPTLYTVGPTLLTTSEATLYTVPSGAAGTGFIIRGIHVAPSGNVNTTFNLTIGADAVGTRWAYLQTLLAAEGYDWSGFWYVPQAATIRGLAADANAATIFITGTLEA